MKRENVEHVLISMGMPVKLKGFKYITDAIMLLATPAESKVDSPVLQNRADESGYGFQSRTGD